MTHCGTQLLLAVLLLAFRDAFLRVIRFGFGLGDLFVPGFVQSGAKPHIDGKALAGAPFIYVSGRSQSTRCPASKLLPKRARLGRQ
jgi:hypothetical protein